MKYGNWPSILTIYLFGVLGAATTSKIIPLQTLFDGLGAGPRLFSWMLALIGLPAAVLAVASGVVADRIGARRFLLISAAVGCAANAGYLVASSAAPFVIGRLIEGLALIGIFTAAPALLMGTTEGRRRVSAMTLWSTYSPAGVSLGFALGAASAARHSLHLVFAAHGALFAMVLLAGIALPASSLPPATARHSVRERLTALIDAYRQPRIVRLAIGFFLILSVAFGMSMVLPGYFGRIHGISAAHASAILSGSNLAMIPGSFAAGALLARGNRAVIVFSITALPALLAGLTLLWPGTSPELLVPALCIWSLCLGSATATFLTSLPIVADPARLGAAAGLFAQAGAMATLLNPPLWLAILASGRWGLFLVLLVFGWSAALLLLHQAIRAGDDPLTLSISLEGVPAARG